MGANLYRLIYNLVTAIVLSQHKLSDIHSQIWFYFLMKFTLLPVILTLSNNWLDQSKQDSGSNRLKGWSKILHTVKSNREKHNDF